MIPLDYGRSFLAGKGPYNAVRFWVESRTRLVDDRNGTTEDYIQCGACKSEDTFAEKDLFYEDNYDFIPVFGPQDGIIFRRRAWLNPNYRTIQPAVEMWGGQELHLVEVPTSDELTTPDSIVQATHAYRPIVAQTTLHNRNTGLSAVIECPVKTLNTRKGENLYQVDTGPIAFPELDRRPDRKAELFSLAFIAFNVPHFAEFVIEVPTAIDGAEVHHYSRRVSLEATNRLFAVNV